jgi:hypothetical protein
MNVIAMFLLLAASAFAHGRPVAAAAQTPGHYLGVGTQSCGEWLASHEEFNKTRREAGSGGLFAMKLSWLQGFLTGYSFDGLGNPGSNSRREVAILERRWQRIPHPDALLVWMDNYCQAHPLNDLMTAGQTLYGEINK